MKDVVEQHIAGILKELRSDVCVQAVPPAVARSLKKYLENLPHKDLLSINAIMYSGRDQDPPRKIEHYIDRCSLFTKEELVQAMLIRLDNLQEYLNRGMDMAAANWNFTSGPVELC